MALLSEVKEWLRIASGRCSDYLVAEESEKSSDTIRSWIIGVYYDSGDVILRHSMEGIRDRDRAMSVMSLYEAVLSLPASEHDPVELSVFAQGGPCRIDCPVVGAHELDDRGVFVFDALEPGEN